MDSPSTSRQNEDAFVVDGRLDLSGRSLTALARRFVVEYGEATSVDLSRNSLKAMPNAKMFIRCKKLDLSGNCLTHLSSLSPLARKLVHLCISDNRLTRLDGLHLLAQLEWLNVSLNAITDFPLLPSSGLRYLDLSSNELTCLPDVSSLSHLEFLSVASNRIASLSRARLPSSLRCLNLSSNALSSLSQLFRVFKLPLRSISVAGNPCFHHAPFDYRPFLHSLFFETLEEVDGRLLTETEVLRGELLLTSKIGRMQREMDGDDQALVDCLTKECPFTSLVPSNPLSPLDKKLMKVLDKRREYVSSDEYSSHSPFSDWRRQLTGDKENIPSSKHSDWDDHLSTPPPSRFPSRPPSSLPSVSSPSLPSQLISSSIPSPSLLIPPPSQAPIPLPRSDMNRIWNNAATRIQVWWKKKRECREEEREKKTEKNKVSAEMKETKDDERRGSVAEDVAELAKQFQLQVEYNEMFVETLERMEKELRRLRRANGPPTPQSLECLPDGGHWIVRWQMPVADNYEVLIDGLPSGVVRAPSRSFVIDNLVPGPHSISIRAIRGDSRSAFSDPVQMHS